MNFGERPAEKQANVYVLDGGFYQWARCYGDEKDLIEDFDDYLWTGRLLGLDD